MGAEVTSWYFGGGVAVVVNIYACGWWRKRTWTYEPWLDVVLAWGEILSHCPFGPADAYIGWCQRSS